MKNSLPDLLTPVFITGATGFIGQRLISKLLEQGHGVRVMVRPEQSTDSRVPNGCEQIPVSLTDVDKLASIVAESSAVFYCAGSVRGRKPADFDTANIKGIKSMLEALEQVSDPPPMLLLSSLAASRPQLSDYAYSKYKGELLMHGKPGLSWTILRPPAVYGPGDQEMLPLLKMIRRGLLVRAGPRDQRLSLLHVDDLANAMTTWLSASQQCSNKTYSIDDGTPGGYDWDAIGAAVSDGQFRIWNVPRFLLKSAAEMNLLLSFILGYAPMLTPGKVRELIQPDWLCDNSDFAHATGWSPTLDLRRGVQQLFQAPLL